MGNKTNGNSTLHAPPIPVETLDVSKIDADYEFNSRTHLTDVPELAKSILINGQNTPIVVEEAGNGRYNLIAGFRRFAAISWPADKGGLARPTIRAQVQPTTSEVARVLGNLLENVARRDLSTYDTARSLARAQQLASKPGSAVDPKSVSPRALADSLAVTESYVRNLLRAWNNLPPAALKRWGEECSPDWEEKKLLKICTMPNLNKWSREGLSVEERERQYLADLHPSANGDGSGSGDGGSGEGSGGDGSGDGGGGGSADKPKRPSATEVEAALDNANEVMRRQELPAGMTHDYYAGAVAFAHFCLGQKVTIKGILPLPREPKAKAAKAPRK